MNQNIKTPADPADEALAKAKALITKKGPFTDQEAAFLWRTAIDGVLDRKTGPYEAVGIALNRLGGDRTAHNVFNQLFQLAAFPREPRCMSFVIRTGAAVARMNTGKVPEGVDKEWYTHSAKRALFTALELGFAETRAYAAEALATIPDKSVAQALEHMVKTEPSGIVKKAMCQTIGLSMTRTEFMEAKRDHDYLQSKYGQGSPQALFLDMLYDAAKTAFRHCGQAGEDTSLCVAVKLLSGFPRMNGNLARLFPSSHGNEDLETAGFTVENALAHILRTGSVQLRNEAADGLCAMKSERVKRLLARISQEQPGSEASTIASGCLTRIVRGESLKADAGASIFRLPHYKPRQAVAAAAISPLPRNRTR